MNRQLNEIARMQKLAGILKENEEQNITPEQAVQKVMPLVSKIENNPELDKVAQKIAKNPTLMAQLKKALAKGGIQANLNEIESELDTIDMKTLMFNFAKKSELQEKISNDLDQDTYSSGLSIASFVGGGLLGSTFQSAVLAVVPGAATIFAGPGLVGAVAGVVLFLIARKIYLMNNPDV
jgi:enoyl-[acyl-carrier-protein] reductase (NADH)